MTHTCVPGWPERLDDRCETTGKKSESVGETCTLVSPCTACNTPAKACNTDRGVREGKRKDKSWLKQVQCKRVCVCVCVLAHWICRAAWTRAGRPRSEGGCRLRGHSARRARPRRRDPPGTPLPRRSRTPGAGTHAAVSHRWETMARLCAATGTRRVHKSHTLYVASCASVRRLRRGRDTLVRVFRLTTQSLTFILTLLSLSPLVNLCIYVFMSVCIFL